MENIFSLGFLPTPYISLFFTVIQRTYFFLFSILQVYKIENLKNIKNFLFQDYIPFITYSTILYYIIVSCVGHLIKFTIYPLISLISTFIGFNMGFGGSEEEEKSNLDIFENLFDSSHNSENNKDVILDDTINQKNNKDVILDDTINQMCKITPMEIMALNYSSKIPNMLSNFATNLPKNFYTEKILEQLIGTDHSKNLKKELISFIESHYESDLSLGDNSKKESDRKINILKDLYEIDCKLKNKIIKFCLFLTYIHIMKNSYIVINNEIKYKKTHGPQHQFFEDLIERIGLKDFIRNSTLKMLNKKKMGPHKYIWKSFFHMSFDDKLVKLKKDLGLDTPQEKSQKSKTASHVLKNKILDVIHMANQGAKAATKDLAAYTYKNSDNGGDFLKKVLHLVFPREAHTYDEQDDPRLVMKKLYYDMNYNYLLFLMAFFKHFNCKIGDKKNISNLKTQIEKNLVEMQSIVFKHLRALLNYGCARRLSRILSKTHLFQHAYFKKHPFKYSHKRFSNNEFFNTQKAISIFSEHVLMRAHPEYKSIFFGKSEYLPTLNNKMSELHSVLNQNQAEIVAGMPYSLYFSNIFTLICYFIGHSPICHMTKWIPYVKNFIITPEKVSSKFTPHNIKKLKETGLLVPFFEYNLINSEIDNTYYPNYMRKKLLGVKFLDGDCKKLIENFGHIDSILVHKLKVFLLIESMFSDISNKNSHHKISSQDQIKMIFYNSAIKNSIKNVFKSLNYDRPAHNNLKFENELNKYVLELESERLKKNLVNLMEIFDFKLNSIGVEAGRDIGTLFANDGLRSQSIQDIMNMLKVMKIKYPIKKADILDITWGANTDFINSIINDFYRLKNLKPYQNGKIIIFEEGIIFEVHDSTKFKKYLGNVQISNRKNKLRCLVMDHVYHSEYSKLQLYLILKNFKNSKKSCAINSATKHKNILKISDDSMAKTITPQYGLAYDLVRDTGYTTPTILFLIATMISELYDQYVPTVFSIVVYFLFETAIGVIKNKKIAINEKIFKNIFQVTPAFCCDNQKIMVGIYDFLNINIIKASHDFFHEIRHHYKSSKILLALYIVPQLISVGYLLIFLFLENCFWPKNSCKNIKNIIHALLNPRVAIWKFLYLKLINSRHNKNPKQCLIPTATSLIFKILNFFDCTRARFDMFWYSIDKKTSKKIAKYHINSDKSKVNAMVTEYTKNILSVHNSTIWGGCHYVIRLFLMDVLIGLILHVFDAFNYYFCPNINHVEQLDFGGANFSNSISLEENT